MKSKESEHENTGRKKKKERLTPYSGDSRDQAHHTGKLLFLNCFGHQKKSYLPFKHPFPH